MCSFAIMFSGSMTLKVQGLQFELSLIIWLEIPEPDALTFLLDDDPHVVVTVTVFVLYDDMLTLGGLEEVFTEPETVTD